MNPEIITLVVFGCVTSDLLKSRWLVMGQAAGSAIPGPFSSSWCSG